MSLIDRIPAAINLGTSYDGVIYALWTHFKMFNQEEDLDISVSDRYVLGYPLPPFQRPHVWSLEQEKAFIQSIWLGLPLGSYTFHELDSQNKPPYLPIAMSGWLLDGQQRLTAIERYWNNEFAVFDLYWNELTPVEQRRFQHTKFSHFKVRLSSEDQAREVYDRLSFGGTAHTEDQRAVGSLT